jgi:hypothetical protein
MCQQIEKRSLCVQDAVESSIFVFAKKKREQHIWSYFFFFFLSQPAARENERHGDEPATGGRDVLCYAATRPHDFMTSLEAHPLHVAHCTESSSPRGTKLEPRDHSLTRMRRRSPSVHPSPEQQTGGTESRRMHATRRRE